MTSFCQPHAPTGRTPGVPAASAPSRFEDCGQVSSATLVMDRETGRPRGFGFVEMNNDAEARKAIEALNGKNFGGRDLTVNEAKPREGGGGGNRRGGFGGGGGGGGRGGW